MNRGTTFAAIAALLLIAPVAAQPAAMEEADARSRGRCAAMTPDQGQTGMLFNPPGLRTVYDRSQCYQELAVQLGDAALCERAIERKSLFFDGSGISPSACRHLVAQRIEQDKAEAASIQLQAVTSLALQIDGNGRDLDVLVGTSGGSASTHRLVIALAAPREVVLIDMVQPLGATPTELRHLLRASALEKALGGHRNAFSIRAELSLAPRDLDQRRVFAHLPPRTAAARTIACERAAGRLRCATLP